MKLDNLLNVAGADVPVRRIPLSAIADNPYQPRRRYPADGLADLARNIWALADQLPDTLGLQQLPAGRLVDGNGEPLGQVDDVDEAIERGARIQLAFGHRRVRACEMLGTGKIDGIAAHRRYLRIPVYIVEASDKDMLMHAVSENQQRSDITAIEQANALSLAKEMGMTQAEIADMFGKGRSTVANLLRLLELPTEIQGLILDSKLSGRHGRELLRLEGQKQLEAAVWAANTRATVEALTGSIDKTLAAETLRRRDVVKRGEPITQAPPAERVQLATSAYSGSGDDLAPADLMSDYIGPTVREHDERDEVLADLLRLMHDVQARRSDFETGTGRYELWPALERALGACIRALQDEIVPF